MPGTTCDCPATISDRAAVGLSLSRNEEGEPAVVVRYVAIIETEGVGRRRLARHLSDMLLMSLTLEEGWPTTSRPRSVRATTG